MMRTIPSQRALRLSLTLILILSAATNALAQIGCNVPQMFAPIRKGQTQIDALFSTAPALENSTNAVWASARGVGQMDSAAYAGRRGTPAENYFLYLYRIRSLGGVAANPDFEIPLNYAPLNSTILGNSYVEVSARPEGAGSTAFPDAADVYAEGLNSATTSQDFVLFDVDDTGVFRSSTLMGFVTNRKPALGLGLIRSGVSFGSNVVTAVVPENRTSIADRLFVLRGRAAELVTESGLLHALEQTAADISSDAERVSPDLTQLQLLEMRLVGADDAIDYQVRVFAGRALNLEIALRRTIGSAGRFYRVVENTSVFSGASGETTRQAMMAQAAADGQRASVALSALLVLKPEISSLDGLPRELAQALGRISTEGAVATMDLNTLIFTLENAARLATEADPQAPMPPRIPYQPVGCTDSPPVFPPPTIAQETVSWSIPAAGGLSAAATGEPDSARPGSVRIQISSGTSPSGFALLTFSQNGTLTSQVAIPATAPVRSGRVRAQVDRSAANNPIDTAVAFINPGDAEVDISFGYTLKDGTLLGRNGLRLRPNQHVSAFLSQRPFNLGNSFDGTMTFTSTSPIVVLAIHGRTNERGEYLFSILPVADLSVQSDSSSVLPQFVEGSGWSTEVTLVNPTSNRVSTGVLEFWDASGRRTGIVPYAIATAGTQIFRLADAGAPFRSGYIRVLPALLSPSPLASVSIVQRKSGLTVSEHIFGATRDGTAFRTFAASPRAGVIVANTLGRAAAIRFELLTLAGTSTGFRGSAVLAGNGQLVSFLNEIAGFEGLPASFQGVLLVTTPDSRVAVAAFQSQYNRRSDFLVTPIPVENDNQAAPGGTLVFPHFVIGGGYTTQFILFNRAGTLPTSGTLRFLDQAGLPMPMVLR